MLNSYDYKNLDKVPMGFWDSIGAVAYKGQFINDNHKIFFLNNLSERYSSSVDDSRMIYIYKKDAVTERVYGSMEGEVDALIQDYAIHIFKFMILNIFTKETGKCIVRYKTNIDKISFRQNQLKYILKQNYQFEREIEDYRRYVKDEPWKDSEMFVGNLFFENDMLICSFDRVPLLGHHQNFQDSAITSKAKIDQDLKMVLDDFQRKKEILLSLFEYRNVRITWGIGVLTLIVACVTLLATLKLDGGFFIFLEIVQEMIGLFRSAF